MGFFPNTFTCKYFGAQLNDEQYGGSWCVDAASVSVFSANSQFGTHSAFTCHRQAHTDNACRRARPTYSVCTVHTVRCVEKQTSSKYPLQQPTNDPPTSAISHALWLRAAAAECCRSTYPAHFVGIACAASLFWKRETTNHSRYTVKSVSMLPKMICIAKG